MKFAKWMATPFGRILRIVLGAVVVWIGLGPVGGTAGWIIAAVGVLPMLAGLYNVCLIAPLLRVPFRGRDLEGRGKSPPPATTSTPAGQH